MAQKGISVIICTYNGAERLNETIAHVAQQVIPAPISWEVVLADNGSTDNSAETGQREWEKHAISTVPFRVIKEKKAGKLFALQKAVNAANYEYLVICDDDNWLAPDYLNKVWQLFTAMPDVVALGGFGIPVTNGVALPEWFNDYTYAYAVGAQAKETGILAPRAFLWGAGMATHKSVYQEMYKTVPSLLPEHNETNILSAEDTEYSLRLQLKDYKLYYDDSLVYQHYIPAARLTVAYREKLLKGFRDSYAILGKYHTAIRVKTKFSNRPYRWLFLMIASLWTMVFSRKKHSRERARNTLFFLIPSSDKNNPILNSIRTFLKDTKIINGTSNDL